MKEMINAFDYAGEICKAMSKGVLLTAKAGEKVNPMTIGWGTVGIEWGKPIFIAFVRESRYTRQLLDTCGEFTVNVPVGDSVGNIISYCGTKSGRDCDKVAALNLTLEDPVKISVPGIRELPLTLECKVLYKQAQVLESIPADLLEKYYSNRNQGDFHYAYYAEIVSAYIIKD